MTIFVFVFEIRLLRARFHRKTNKIIAFLKFCKVNLLKVFTCKRVCDFLCISMLKTALVLAKLVEHY